MFPKPTKREVRNIIDSKCHFLGGYVSFLEGIHYDFQWYLLNDNIQEYDTKDKFKLTRISGQITGHVNHRSPRMEIGGSLPYEKTALKGVTSEKNSKLAPAKWMLGIRKNFPFGAPFRPMFHRAF